MLAYRRFEPPRTLMQSTSLAPELSATRRRDSCWIILPAPPPRGPASAWSWTTAASPSPSPGRRRWCRRGRRGAWCAGRSCCSGGGAPAPRPAPPPSCPWRWRPPPPRAPCGGWAAQGQGTGRRRRCQYRRPLHQRGWAGRLGSLLASFGRFRLLAPGGRSLVVRARLGLAGGGQPAGVVGLCGLDLPLAQERLDPSHVLSHLADAGHVVQLASGQLEAQVEQLLAAVGQPLLQLVVVQLGELLGLDPYQPPSEVCDPVLVTTRALIGSFWMARSSASRPSSSLTPASSNITRPGLTTATQTSGFPLPEPMRVSAGFLVTGLSGKIRIQTL